jgi:hypothetical protein
VAAAIALAGLAGWRVAATMRVKPIAPPARPAPAAAVMPATALPELPSPSMPSMMDPPKLEVATTPPPAPRVAPSDRPSHVRATKHAHPTRPPAHDGTPARVDLDAPLPPK